MCQFADRPHRATCFRAAGPAAPDRARRCLDDLLRRCEAKRWSPLAGLDGGTQRDGRAPRTRTQMSNQLSSTRSKIVAGVVAVVSVGLAVGLPLGLSGGKGSPKATGTTATSSTTVPVPPPQPARPKAVVLHRRCPLTDLPVRTVPRRPALMVKVGNEPYGARPQSGLDEADVVFDTPAEGFIMRYIAVFQCHNASSIGPTRSVRWVDWHLARAFGGPLLAFAGGINPDVNAVESLPWLHAANLLEGAQGAAERISSRAPPDNLYTSTTSLYSLVPSDHTLPPAVFQFSGAVPHDGLLVKSFGIDISYGTDVIWKWESDLRQWLHTYSGSIDVDAATGRPVTATNVVVISVGYTFGPYIESPGSSGDVESQTTGDGPGYVLRNGEMIRMTWHRPWYEDGFSFTDRSGRPVALEPGRTFVELVPVGTAMVYTH